jgi:hypothetical protein
MPVRPRQREDAKNFYLCCGFEPSPTDPLHLVLLLKDLPDCLQADEAELGVTA